MKKLKAKISLHLLITYLVIVIVLVYGWVWNIINLFSDTYDSMGVVALGAIGVIVAPLGALVHFIAG